MTPSLHFYPCSHIVRTFPTPGSPLPDGSNPESVPNFARIAILVTEALNSRSRAALSNAVGHRCREPKRLRVDRSGQVHPISLYTSTDVRFVASENIHEISFPRLTRTHPPSNPATGRSLIDTPKVVKQAGIPVVAWKASSQSGFNPERASRSRGGDGGGSILHSSLVVVAENVMKE